jgi:hypothetical protein
LHRAGGRRPGHAETRRETRHGTPHLRGGADSNETAQARTCVFLEATEAEDSAQQLDGLISKEKGLIKNV